MFSITNGQLYTAIIIFVALVIGVWELLKWLVT